MVHRLGVLGDIHGEADALRQSLRFFDEQGIDTIVAVGDIVDGPGDVDACCELLQERGVLTVRGNHDRWFLGGEMLDLPHKTQHLKEENRRFLESLPATETLRTPQGSLLLCHGVGDDDMAILTPETYGYGLQAIYPLREAMLDPDLVFMVGGHTHRKMVRQFVGLIVINAGTLYRDHDPCFLVLDLDASLATYHAPHEGWPLIEEVTIPAPTPAEPLGSAW
jgi:putative phosphoesterase